MPREKGSYRSVYSAIWDDPEFQAFDLLTRQVFFYLRTNKDCNFPCIYVFYPSIIAEYFPGVKQAAIDKAWDTLSHTLWIAYQRPILWIVKGLKNEPNYSTKSEQQKSGIVNILKALPKLNILNEFAEYYGIDYKPEAAKIPSPLPYTLPSPLPMGEQGTGTGTGTGTGEGTGSTSFAPTPGNGSGSKPKAWVNLISWNREKGCFEGIAPEMFEKWEKAYPAVDLNSQLNRADEWLKANPTKRKSNYYRFIVNWLSRAQERGGR